LLAPARAQFIWQQATGTAAFDETSTNFIAVPGGYLHVGQGGGNATATNLPNHLYLAKLSPAGAVLWQQSPSFAYRNAKVLYPTGAAADASGQFYVASQFFPLKTTLSGSPSFGLLVKFTASGDTLWSRVLLGLTHSAYAQVVATADGGVVVIGQNDLDQFVAKFSPTGQELWHRTYLYNSTLTGYLDNLVLLPTGGFLVAQSPNYGGVPDKYLVLDAQGQLLTSKPARPYKHFFLRLDAAGNVLDGAGRLYKVSPLGDTLWSRQYSQYGRKVDARLAIENPGGQYLVGGQRFNGLDYDLSLLLVEKTTGAVLRDTLLVRYGGDELITGLHLDAQGNYLVGGSVSDNGPLGGADQFAFLLRGWGRLLPTRPSAAGALAGYSLFPNPAESGQTVRLASPAGPAYAGAYELRDALGQLVRHGAALPTGGLPTQALPPGLYLLRIRPAAVWLPALRLQVLP